MTAQVFVGWISKDGVRVYIETLPKEIFRLVSKELNGLAKEAVEERDRHFAISGSSKPSDIEEWARRLAADVASAND